MSYMNDDARVGWMVLILRLPSEPSRHRVAVWRELRRVGAIQLGQGSWALPDAPPFTETIDRIVEIVGNHEGEVLVLRACAADEPTSVNIRGLYDEARRAEWAEFEFECDKCVAELAREILDEKFTLAELDEEEQNVERLRRWHRAMRSRDLFDSVPANKTQQHLDTCAAELDHFTALVYEAVGLD